jgi:hypothetical protein
MSRGINRGKEEKLARSDESNFVMGERRMHDHRFQAIGEWPGRISILKTAMVVGIEAAQERRLLLSSCSGLQA